MEKLSPSERDNILIAAVSGDPEIISRLSPAERKAYHEMIANQGIITIFPVPEQDPTAGKLVNPVQDENKGTTLITPDQRSENVASSTGNTDGVPDTGGHITTTPVAGVPSKEEYVYLNEKIPGLTEVRPENTSYPANQDVIKQMDDPKFKGWANDTQCTDCSDIVPKLLAAAGGHGKIIEVRPLKAGNLNFYENGKVESDMTFHQVYTDGKYVYDPRVSARPLTKGDWEKHIRSINPEGINISDKLKGFK